MKAIEVVAGIIWQNGSFLAAKRPEGKMGAGFWEFPGGKVEENESLAEAMIRELDEELGITALKYKFWQSKQHSYPDRVINLHVFNIYEFLGEITLTNCHTELAWVLPEKAKQMNFLAADISVVNELQNLQNSQVVQL